MRDEPPCIMDPDEPDETAPLLLGAEDANGNGKKPQSSRHGTFANHSPDSSSSVSGPEVEVEEGEVISDSDDVETREGLPEIRKKMWMLIPAIGIGVFMCALDQLLITSPLYGKLSDIFGRKECLLFSYLVFGLGCLGCGMAQDIYQICVARAVAGIGGGGMNSVVSILITDIVPLRDRGVWQGYINIIFAAGTSTGAPLGGWLADSIGWRWSFMGQAPLCLLAFIAVYFVLDLPKADHGHWLDKLAKVDFLGALCLVSAVFALLVGLDSGSNTGWSDKYTIIALCVTPVLFAVFIFVEMKVASHPFAPGHIIFERSLFACYLANFFGVAGQIAPVFCLPLFFQAVNGMSAARSGTLLVPAMVSAVLASLGGGIIIRRTGRYYWVTVASFAVLLFSMVPLVLFAGAWKNITAGVVIGLVLTALGAGSAITTTLIALISNAPQSDAAVVIACSYLFRSLGSSIGISTSTALLQQVLRTQLAARLGDDAGGIEDEVRKSLDAIKNLDPETQKIVRRCYQLATMGAFVPTTIFLIAALAASFFIREKRLG
ncbi:multidrug resistance protein fnx1 (MFS multidrug transporter) [Zalerion maritima]|uniref:Multidrug resistance protein fnx1 (MFS multidrug transporter) n=1 Tax=Zalerion maritima TaxID=339359 RepID=A0AAD5WUD1_9PEZI|nr:multidrug resistance protein fnx1 (MFS multidrug transporter) [Zalerion maritima]